MEQLLDEREMSLFAGGQELGELADTVELDPLAGAGLVRAGRVDRSTLLPVSISADGVVVFEGESQGIDHPVAGLARRGLGLELDALARAQAGVESGGQGSDGLRRGPQRPAQETPGEEHPAMDGRA